MVPMSNTVRDVLFGLSLYVSNLDCRPYRDIDKRLLWFIENGIEQKYDFYFLINGNQINRNFYYILMNNLPTVPSIKWPSVSKQ